MKLGYIASVFTAFLFSGFFFCPNFALADTTIVGAISSDQTWSPAGGVYIIDSNFSIPAGVTLTVEPGTIIKSKNTGPLGLPISGCLVAKGTIDNPIYFTSIFDNSVGGETYEGQNSIGGGYGQWQGLYFGAGSKGIFEYVEIRYAGYSYYEVGYGRNVGIENDGGTIDINHSIIRDNYKIVSNGAGGGVSSGSGISNKTGFLSVSNSIISNNTVGIIVDNGTSTISANIFKDNVDSTNYGIGYGLYAYGPGKIVLTDNIFFGNNRTVRINIPGEFIHSGNISSDKANRGYEVSGIVSDDTVFSGEDLPYIVKNIFIKDGKTLTIEPGTILKMDDYWNSGSIYVQEGNLIVKGTKDKKIYITSLRNDLVGGDTNGDGNNTAPAIRDWASIFLENGANAEFDNVVVSYGGYNWNGEYLNIAAVIYQRGAKFSILNSVFENNYGAAIYQDAGTTTISSSEFTGQDVGLWSRGGAASISQSNMHDNASYAINNQSGVDLGWWWQTRPLQIIDARNNWWGSSDGPNNVSTTTITGTGDKISENILYVPFLTEPPSENILDPVLIIPGIIGTELYNGSDLIWLDLSQLSDLDDYFLTNSLSLDQNGNSVNNITTEDVIKRIIVLNIFDTNIFDGLQQSFESNGYQENKNFFFFPYDWRLDLDKTQDLLNQKIEEIKSQTGKDKVNIVAHSMGGLLVKDYLNTYGKNSVDKLIFIGTPHLGAPKAGKILLEGDRLSIPWLEEDRIQEIAQNSPALYELLPNQDYFSQFQGYLRKYKLFGDNQLMNYEDTKNFLLNDKGKNPTVFNTAEDLFSKNLQNFDFSGIKTYNIVGCKTPTQAAYSFDVLGGIGQTGYTSGDGTVPMASADFINIPIINKFYVKDGVHVELPSANGVRNLIIDILNKGPGNSYENISSGSSICNFKGKKLTWHSPVEVHIYDSNGNHTGPIENNAIEYGIPGLDYDIMGHNKFIFLPTNNEESYHIKAIGSENGSFDLSISEVENGQYGTTHVFNDVPVTISSAIDFDVSNLTEDNVVELETNEEKKEVYASAVLDGDEILDITPPKTDILLYGKEYKDGEYKKEVEVEFASTDDNSGLLGTWYSLDGRNFTKYTGRFVVGEEGIYNVHYFSIDNAGNNENENKQEIIIGKLSKNLRKLE